jgi:hypothetical protein
MTKPWSRKQHGEGRGNLDFLLCPYWKLWLEMDLTEFSKATIIFLTHCCKRIYSGTKQIIYSVRFFNWEKDGFDGFLCIPF